MKNFIEELSWRGMIHDKSNGIEQQLSKEITKAYIGFDPTADSLHVGNLVQIMILVHFQLCGHQPIALVGGATGMVGDPSGKSNERNLLNIDMVQHNLSCIKKQLEKFLVFEGNNKAEILNNYNWMSEFKFLDFIRDIGKHININYMLSKDSVQSRINTGLSFTEFSYQLVQGYDYYWLWKNKGVKLQLGGSDQWGNILTGIELIRKIGNGDSFALTSPLITKDDGTKFGKTEKGNVWLNSDLTSPYHFYQFWLNASDTDIEKYIKIFSVKSKDEILSLIDLHKQQPHLRILQKSLAEEITIRVHSKEEYQTALNASEILFGQAPTESLQTIDEKTLLRILDGVPTVVISRSTYENSTGFVDLLSVETESIIFSSKGECRRLIQSGGVQVNKVKINDENVNSKIDLLKDKYLLVQKGKKNYFLIIVK